MDSLQLIDAFKFDNNFIFYEHIHPITAIEAKTFIFDRQWNLKLYVDVV